jgi:hypothetical protein
MKQAPFVPTRGLGWFHCNFRPGNIKTCYENSWNSIAKLSQMLSQPHRNIVMLHVCYCVCIHV